MTRMEYYKMNFDDFMKWANDYLDDVTDEETLKCYVIDLIQMDSFALALHIISAIYDNPSSTGWYRYDYTMGTLETPTPIIEKEDIKDLILFDDEQVD